MFVGSLKLYAFAGAVILASLGGWSVRGWYEGAQDTKALEEALSARVRAEQAAKAAAEAAGTAELARLAIETERDDLARQLEDQAHADQDDRGGLPRSRVDRLRQR